MHTFFDLTYAIAGTTYAQQSLFVSRNYFQLFTFHSSLFILRLRSAHRFIIPGFRKNDVSQKRRIGEHRDREWREAAMDEGKTIRDRWYNQRSTVLHFYNKGIKALKGRACRKGGQPLTRGEG